MENADNRKVLPSAQDYINGNQFQRNDNQEILEEFRYKMKWRETETVLDVGCGPGDVTNDLLLPVIKEYSKEFSILATDIDSKVIDEAKIKYLNISFDKLDIGSQLSKEWILSKKSKFSKLFSFYALHWVKDQKMVLNNSYQLLQKRGEALFIAVVDIPYVHVFENLSKESKWKQYMYSLEEAFPLPFRKWQNPAKTYTEMAKEIGFEVVSCEEIIKDHQYNALTWKAVNPFLPRIKDEHEQEEFLQDLHEEMKIVLKGNSKCWVKLLVIHLRK